MGKEKKMSGDEMEVSAKELSQLRPWQALIYVISI